jgi:purine-binding chemotaxis protein CheW
MNQQQTVIDKRAAELRHAFDHGFAEAPAGERESTEAFLAIGVAGDHYVLRLADISGLHADKKITQLPSDVFDLLGVASFRGALIPVYDLRVLLGYPAGDHARWLVLIAPQTPVALAFDRFDGHLRLSHDAVTHEEKMQQDRHHIAGSVRSDGQVRPVVNVASMIELIKKRAQSGVTHKER